MREKYILFHPVAADSGTTRGCLLPSTPHPSLFTPVPTNSGSVTGKTYMVVIPCVGYRTIETTLPFVYACLHFKTEICLKSNWSGVPLTCIVDAAAPFWKTLLILLLSCTNQPNKPANISPSGPDSLFLINTRTRWHSRWSSCSTSRSVSRNTADLTIHRNNSVSLSQVLLTY